MCREYCIKAVVIIFGAVMDNRNNLGRPVKLSQSHKSILHLLRQKPEITAAATSRAAEYV